MRALALASAVALAACSAPSGPVDAGSTGGGSAGGGAGGAAGGAGGSGGGSALAAFTSKGTSSYETQTSLAVSGTSVVAVWIALFADSTSSIGYAVSRNSGSTFTAPAYLQSPGSRLASNPVVVADSQGRFTVAWLGFRVGASTDEHVYVSRLDNTTNVFGAATLASDDGTSTSRDFDKPSLMVDANDNLLLTWADFTGSPSVMPSLTFARSTNGTDFTRSTVIGDNTFGNLASLCSATELGPNAPLYLVHLGASGTITLRVSSNQGTSWTARATPAAQVVFQDVTCVAHGTDLWVAYASGAALFSSTMDSPGDAVQLMHSANGGMTFDAPVTVSTGAAQTQYLFPRIARAPSGKLQVVYYQGLAGMAASLQLAASPTGAAFTVSPITTTGTLTLDRTLASWLGAYTGLAVTGTQTYVSYAQNTENKAHVSFAQVAAP